MNSDFLYGRKGNIFRFLGTAPKLNPLQILPTDILYEIFLKLKKTDVATVACLNKSYKKLIDCENFWKIFYQRSFSSENALTVLRQPASSWKVSVKKTSRLQKLILGKYEKQDYSTNCKGGQTVAFDRRKERLIVGFHRDHSSSCCHNDYRKPKKRGLILDMKSKKVIGDLEGSSLHQINNFAIDYKKNWIIAVGRDGKKGLPIPVWDLNSGEYLKDLSIASCFQDPLEINFCKDSCYLESHYIFLDSDQSIVLTDHQIVNYDTNTKWFIEEKIIYYDPKNQIFIAIRNEQLLCYQLDKEFNAPVLISTLPSLKNYRMTENLYCYAAQTKQLIISSSDFTHLLSWNTLTEETFLIPREPLEIKPMDVIFYMHLNKEAGWVFLTILYKRKKENLYGTKVEIYDINTRQLIKSFKTKIPESANKLHYLFKNIVYDYDTSQMIGLAGKTLTFWNVNTGKFAFETEPSIDQTNPSYVGKTFWDKAGQITTLHFQGESWGASVIKY